MSKIIDKLELAIEVNKLLEDIYPDVSCGVNSSLTEGAYLVLKSRYDENRFPRTDDIDDIIEIAKELHSDGFTKVGTICAYLVGTTVWVDKEFSVVVDDITKDSVVTAEGNFPLDRLYTKE